MENSTFYEVININESTKDTNILRPKNKVQLIVILISFIIVFFSFLLIFLPPIGTIFGILLMLCVLILSIHVFTLRIVFDESTLKKLSLFTSSTVDIADIESIHKMRVIGTVANVPMLVRSVQFKMPTGKSKMNFWVFDYYEVIELISMINDIIETGDN